METIKILGIGIFGIIFGIIVLKWTYNSRKTDMFLSTSLGGYGAGILSILISILYVLRELHIVNW